MLLVCSVMFSCIAQTGKVCLDWKPPGSRCTLGTWCGTLSWRVSHIMEMPPLGPRSSHGEVSKTSSPVFSLKLGTCSLAPTCKTILPTPDLRSRGIAIICWPLSCSEKASAVSKPASLKKCRRRFLGEVQAATEARLAKASRMRISTSTNLPIKETPNELAAGFCKQDSRFWHSMHRRLFVLASLQLGGIYHSFQIHCSECYTAELQQTSGVVPAQRRIEAYPAVAGRGVRWS